MSKLSLIGSCQQVVMINWTAIRSHVIEAQHVLLCIARLVSRVMDFFVAEDVL